MKKAFTLAEVLITLGIIGVVAALTMPMLVAHYKDMQFKVAYKKAYSDASSAFRMMIVNGEYEVPSRIDKGNTNTYYSDFRDVFKILAEKFNTVKTCYDKNNTECFAVGECAEYGCAPAALAFIDSSGRAWTMYNNEESTFIVDTNGDKSPNQLGKDRFPFSFPEEINSKNNEYILPNFNYNMITTNRWCPSGKCYYRSWLTD